MTLYIVPNNKETDGPVQPPAPTAYAMYFDNGKAVAFADNYGELMMALAPGYLVLPPGTQNQIRKSLAHTLAPLIQANALDPELPENVQGSIINLHAKFLSGEATSKDIAAWEASTPPSPLVVLCTTPHSQPHVENSYYWHVCTNTDESLLMALHKYGIVKIMKRDS